MALLSGPRRRAWRALLSVLAGGGLTLSGLGGVSPGALAAGEPAGSTTSTGSSPPPTPAPETPSGTSATPEGVTGSTPPTNTSSTPAPPTTTSAPPTTTSAPPVSAPAPAASSKPGPEFTGSSPVTVEATTVVLPRGRRPSSKSKPGSKSKSKSKPSPELSATHGQASKPAANKPASPASPGTVGANNVAPAPSLVAAQAAALSAQLAGSAASMQALSFYRIPLFLLPIYQAAAAHYGVPWQILAAINEIETNYGNDLSVSSAGAEGWMQFMPSTWMQYGVDALDAGYADPYNPVDAIFAAARYLRAAGAQIDLRAAILAYNHSNEYVDSVLLRAKLISAYPKLVIGTLTGLIDAQLPLTGKLSVGALSTVTSSSATASAHKAKPAPGQPPGPSQPQAQTPGSAPAPSPAAAAAAVGGATSVPQRQQLVQLTGSAKADAVAVQDGRITAIGHSHSLGNYVILRDVYGDVFTYAGLGSIAHSYRPEKSPPTPLPPPAAPSPTGHEAAHQRTGASSQLPLTLAVKARSGSQAPAASGRAVPQHPSTWTFAGPGKVRLFAHPGNPDAIALAAATAGPRRLDRRSAHALQRLPLRVGSAVGKGTALGHMLVSSDARAGHMRFAIRPAGDGNTIDPRAILGSWKQLDAAVHPQGAKSDSSLTGATASGVFLLSKSELERDVLADPGVSMPACSRHEVASGAIDKRVLTVLAFLSRSGLKPTVATLRCTGNAGSVYVPARHIGDAVTISHINGVPIAGHQGASSITDTLIRTVLTLQREAAPRWIVSLMRYPGAPSTLARADHGNDVEIDFAPVPTRTPGPKGTASSSAGSPGASAAPVAPMPTPVVVSGELTPTQWDQLIARIGLLPSPKVSTNPSAGAIRDSQTPASSSGAGAPAQPAGGG
jgi:hypothetical protein